MSTQTDQDKYLLYGKQLYKELYGVEPPDWVPFPIENVPRLESIYETREREKDKAAEKRLRDGLWLCTHCKEYYPLEKFYISRGIPSGWCRACHSNRAKERRVEERRQKLRDSRPCED